MTATLHYFPGRAPAVRAMQDPKTPAWIKDIASTMTGDVAPEDLTMAEPGTPSKILPAQHVPILDYAPADDEQQPSWAGDFWDAVGSACVFIAGGFIGGIIATILVVIHFIQ